MIIHVVLKEDTLPKIARYYGLSVQQIMTANSMDHPQQLVHGQALVIPTIAIYHVLRGKETLFDVAKRYGVQVETIIQANEIQNPDFLSVGTHLLIPPRIHVVQAGENLKEIARYYDVPLPELIHMNPWHHFNYLPPGTILTIPFPKPVIEVNAYMRPDEVKDIREINQLAPLLTYLSPSSYLIQADGGLRSLHDEIAIKATRNNHLLPMMTIMNFTLQDSGTELAHTILSDPHRQNRLITNIIRVMKTKGYQGLNIDFENVHPHDRKNYNEFLKRIVHELHRYGYIATTALAPKTNKDQQGNLVEAHDYEIHGELTDFVILMTYDWGYRLGPPQAISPLNQIKRVLDYAIEAIPREKIMFGILLYARDWILPHQHAQEAETYSVQEAVHRAYKYKATIRYNPITQSPYFHYSDEAGRKHEVWFEDARSIQSKFDLVKHYQLRGISYWELGYPFLQNWLLLKDNFNVRKY